MKTFKLSRSKNYCIAALTCFTLLLFQGCKKNENFSPEESSIMRGKPQKIVENPILETPSPCASTCLVAGQNTNVGSVDVAVNTNGDLLITYNVTKPNIYILETHTDIFKNVEQLKQNKKLSNGGAIPGKFEFKKSFSAGDKITKYTVLIPKSYIEATVGSLQCFNIATHAALSNGETAWGGLCGESSKGVTLDAAKQFPGKNWSVYFEFCLDQCNRAEEIDFTYAWEDLLNTGNDADYNDLVLQANLIKSATELKLTFLATARGAGYDHVFKFRIPRQGITGIFGKSGEEAPSYVVDGDDYIITVFKSTYQALPPTSQQFYANTVNGSACTPYAYQEVVLTIDNSFSYDAARPYNPFITVYPSGTAGVGDSYDLTIFELTGLDTWQNWNGKVYPNGIIIPKDWRWPFERVAITRAYPDFFSTNWANNLADPSLTFDKNACN